jgi:hypothetical protein
MLMAQEIQLTAGDLTLDFVNTLDNRHDPEQLLEQVGNAVGLGRFTSIAQKFLMGASLFGSRSIASIRGERDRPSMGAKRGFESR